jgi:hypothetical protein
MFRCAESFGKQRRRGKPSQPYRLVFLEGVSISPFSFDLAELSNPHADVRKGGVFNPYAEFCNLLADLFVEDSPSLL